MSDLPELVEAMAAYLDHAWTHVVARLGGVPGKNRRSVRVRPIAQAVRDWLEECEEDPRWERLVKKCAQVFSKEGHGKSEWGYREGLKHWLRRERIYLSLLDGVRPNPVEVTEALVRVVRTAEDRVVFLALLEGVAFSRDEMNFGDFQIVRPKAEHLEELLGIPVNRIFYPWAVTSTERLADHWYIRCEMREKRERLSLIYVRDMVAGPVSPRYTDFHPSIEKVLKRIILWDWQGDVPEDWAGFSIPFVIVVRENPLKAPPSKPPTGKLYYRPVFDASGEELGEVPEDWYRLKAEETTQFEVFIREIINKLDNILSLGETWQFMDLGLNYFVKGFFSDGLEQLLWHIVTLEALLGEQGAGVTERLSRRIGAIYSEDQSENELPKETFKELYQLRHNLVHGRPFKSRADSSHLRKARMLARRVANRMVTLLSRIAAEVKAGNLTYIPKREEVLEVLDLEESARSRLAELLRVFPKISE